MNNSIRTEWEKMISRGIIPVIEYQTCENDYFVVELSLSEDNQEIEFSFDSDNKKTWFSGNVVIINDNRYKIAVDPNMSLDEHIRLIDQEMMEGYLLPKSGLYGYQIVSQQWIGEEYHERKTSGCGYSKTQDDFSSFLIDLFGKYCSYCGDIDWMCRGSKYHVGGNFYRIPLNQLKKLVSEQS